MDVWGITIAALRRWYIFLAIFALAGFGAYSAGKSAHPEYEASASALLTPPPTVAPVANPFGNVDGANQALAIILNGPDTETALAQQGLIPSFTVTSQARSSIFNIGVRGENPNQVVATAQAALDIATTQLKQRQTAGGVPDANQIGLQVLSAPVITNVVTDGALRVQAVILVLGAAVALAVAVLFDDIVGLLRRRRRNKKVAAQSDSAVPGHREITGTTASRVPMPQSGPTETGATRQSRRLRPRDPAPSRGPAGGSTSTSYQPAVQAIGSSSASGSRR
ncbi:hypothetical protein [Nakamurella multipartita]|uniref:Lipopolysaccharide biosynthesis protein n=1 Tax=Nakamurella multipartita (strain ATCC 700099 / DSM 44233 / CIP 104796 / JCM 9543 / NBRC 105858 / Y-104) TaxID=479431 RepID=C8XKU8_NAKMY|nr:hypothetical protein [Nakamurella multipartita]ACV80755.1 lipopolysaccharide biosynthesis protein [Nakamurella multipartita DSM 44233]